MRFVSIESDRVLDGSAHIGCVPSREEHAAGTDVLGDAGMLGTFDPAAGDYEWQSSWNRVVLRFSVGAICQLKPPECDTEPAKRRFKRLLFPEAVPRPCGRGT
jgi:hypothetical protein